MMDGQDSVSAGSDDAALFDALPGVRTRLEASIATRIVGQKAVVEAMLIALFSGGHCLFVGVPGLAKTLLVNTTAQSLGLDAGRIQFTPDLMPTDITGSDVLDEDRSTGERRLRFIPGPVFTNLLLADEINRTPPKTQAALLEAMAEGRVTTGGKVYDLPKPFQVFATQNPIEQEGTYTLPEAQLDRFMFSIDVGYPSEAEEIEIVERTTAGASTDVGAVVDGAQLLAMQAMVRRAVIPSPDLVRAAVRLVRASRPGPDAPAVASQYLRWGAGPRASQYLILGTKARAALYGREVPNLADLKAVAPLVLGHRVVLNFQAEAAGLRAPEIVRQLVEAAL
ncbi:MAG: AAA family ATPase [Deltaproteobacteria bacterium]|nr:AAA family ATPase [Deltaproteobacteria bacterium]HCH62319.1 AAA family ATPase [Deltaproteobacteria bacterium]